MSITKDIVLKVANLNRLAIDDARAEALAPELGKIMGFIEQLSEVDTDGVEPLANVVDQDLRLRADEISDGNYRDKILANAPEATQGFFAVPKVVE